MSDPETNTDGNALILMGVFGAPHGLKGEIRIKTFTGDPLSIGRYGPLLTKDGKSFKLTSVRPANEVVIARIKGVADRNAAQALTNIELYVRRAMLGDIKDEDEFFHADLIGLSVENPGGEALGTVVSIPNFGAGDMVEIRPPTGGITFVIPFTKKAVPVIDVAAKRIVVDPPHEIDGDER